MILVHQMGKVGSTAITRSLEESGFECLQTHALGRQALLNVVNFFLDPRTDIERVRHEQTLFRDQLIATKLVERCMAEPGYGLRVITLARDPVDRWFSALLQNFPSHRVSARGYLRAETGRESEDDSECFSAVLGRILEIIRAVPESEELEEVAGGFWHTSLAADPDADFFLKQIGGELAVPFAWFHTQIHKPLGIDLYAVDVSSGFAQVEQGGVELLYVKFEALRDEPEKAQAVLSEFVQADVKIGRSNVSDSKPHFDTIQQLRERFEEDFRDSPLLRGSRYCRHFGY
jgi:hypothetical protein